MDKVSFTMNGAAVSGRAGATILEIARDNGIDIPTLCYLKEYSPLGTCRICVVEVEGSRTLVGSCHTPATGGMVIQTHSPKVLKARRVMLDLMMASHPDTCLVCEAANVCELRQRCAEMDVGLPRFRMKKHYYPVETENPHLARDMAKCILCRRCVTGCRDDKGGKMFSVAYRGFNSKVVYGSDQPVGKEAACRDFDACVALCPTAALLKPLRPGEKPPRQVLFVRG